MASEAVKPGDAVKAGETVKAVTNVTDATFEQDVLKSDVPVLVDFWAVWCGPCRAIAPVVEDLANDFVGKAKIMKMDVDSNRMTPGRYGVRGIPTLLIFKDGQVKEQYVGGDASKEKLAGLLNKYL